MPETTSTLEYAPHPRFRRRRLTRVGFAILVVTLIAACWKWGPIAGQRVAVLRWQRQCAAYEIPAQTVLFESNSVHADELWKSCPDYRLQFGAAFEPKCQRLFEASNPVDTAMRTFMRDRSNTVRPTVFLHELCTPSGQHRIVIIEESTRVQLRAGNVNLNYRVYSLGTLFSAPQNVSKYADRTPSDNAPIWLTIAPGRPDPVDPAHFTIPYSADNKPGVIDGRLTDQDKIVFTIRDGPAATLGDH